MLTASFLLAGFYLLVHIGLIVGIKRLDRSVSKEKPYVSVVVAVRNEGKNIGRLLECLLKQTYRNYEIIIINDRSTDNTRNIIAGVQKNSPHLKCIDITDVPDDMPAKKNALRAGISASTGEIICLTDGDCFPPEKWIEKIVESFGPDIGVVAGYSPYIPPPMEYSTAGKKLMHDFIAYEEIRAAGWSAGSIGLNYGWLCTGRNFSYRRKVYEEIDGFEKIKMSVSGDDDLFLQAVRRNTDWKITYNLYASTFVPTAPPGSFGSFAMQRKRHFSAAKYFPLNMKLFFSLYHFSNLFLFLSPLIYIAGYIVGYMLAICILCKLTADSLLFYFLGRIFSGKKFFRSFVLMEALYIPYNIFMGLTGLIGKYEWKSS
jgi:cellulose synthase/poly-beta-1,6-N-acetylglucosamine synthase-like glycosyltransferase